MDQIHDRLDPELQQPLERAIGPAELPHARRGIDPVPWNAVTDRGDLDLRKKVQVLAPSL